MLVLQVGFWPEAGTFAVKNLIKGTLLELRSPEGFICCVPYWSRDSTLLFFASEDINSVGYPGLWQVDARTGHTETLLASDLNTAFSLASSVYQLPNSQLRLFKGTATGA